MNISRRVALQRAALAFVVPGLLAACSTTTVNGVTTLTLDVSKVTTYADAMGDGSATLLSIPALAAALGPVTVASINALAAEIQTEAATLSTEAGASATLTFTTTSVPAALGAFKADATKLFGYFQAGMAAASSSVASSVVTTFDALETIVSLAQVLAAGEGAASAAPPKMSETQALAVLAR
jgi:hypothetical protein